MNFKKAFFLLTIISSTFLFAEPVLEDQNSSTDIKETPVIDRSSYDKAEIKHLLFQKANIERELIEDNIWSKIYSNYHTYQELKKHQVTLDANIERLEKIKKPTKTQIIELENACLRLAI